MKQQSLVTSYFSETFAAPPLLGSQTHKHFPHMQRVHLVTSTDSEESESLQTQTTYFKGEGITQI